LEYWKKDMLEGSTGVNHIPPVGIYTHTCMEHVRMHIYSVQHVSPYSLAYTPARTCKISVYAFSLSLCITVYNYT